MVLLSKGACARGTITPTRGHQQLGQETIITTMWRRPPEVVGAKREQRIRRIRSGQGAESGENSTTPIETNSNIYINSRSETLFFSWKTRPSSRVKYRPTKSSRLVTRRPAQRRKPVTSKRRIFALRPRRREIWTRRNQAIACYIRIIEKDGALAHPSCRNGISAGFSRTRQVVVNRQDELIEFTYYSTHVTSVTEYLV